jgi:hypothetical protein
VLGSVAQVRAQLGGERVVVDEDVRLAREQEAQRVEVRRADRRDRALRTVEDRDLGVQEARRVLDDLDARVEHHAVHRAAGVVLHEVLVAALQQERHADAARRRGLQRALQRDAGDEVRIGDLDLVARLRDRVAVEVLDALAKAEVVAQHQAGEDAVALRSRRRVQVVGIQLGIVGVGAGARGLLHRRERAGDVDLAGIARGLHAVPQPRHRLVRVFDERPGDAHREVEARLRERATHRIEAVVDDVDAAAKADPRVDDAELAVQAPPARRQEDAPAARRIEDAPAHSRRLPALPPLGRDLAGADAVDDDADDDAARGRALERLGDGDRRTDELEDVGLEHDLGARAIDRLDERGKERLAALQEPEPMAGPKRAVRFGASRFLRAHSSARPEVRRARARRRAAGGPTSAPRRRRAARSSSGNEIRACRSGPSRRAAAATERC